jgi:hypothetical protein
MKFPASKSSIWRGMCIVLCLGVVACHKTIHHKILSPKVAQQMRLEWNQKTLDETYKTAGQTDSRWDAFADRGLNEWARIRSHATDSDEDWAAIISSSCADALNAGCTDPMIRYLSLRTTGGTGTKQEIANQYCKVAQDMEGSAYPNIRKFYAWNRAGEQLRSAYGSRSNFPPELQQVNTWGYAESDLLNALSDRRMPPGEVYDACHELLEVWKWDKDHYPALYQSIEGKLTDDWKDDPLLLLLKGEFYIQTAWQARGYGYANTITSDGAKLFADRLDMAD